MKRPTIDAIKFLLYARTDDLQSLQLSWFGGEPLLAEDIILEINSYASALYRGKNYSSSISTNGFYLTFDLFTALLKSGLRRFQISLDGPARVHDKSRVTLRGNGTFNTIWQNLLATRNTKEDFTINLRLHVTEDNCESLPELVDQIVVNFSGDTRYKIFLKEIVKLGGPNDAMITRLSSARFSRTLDAVRSRCEGTLTVDFDDEKNPYVCYASRLNSLLIRSDGRIGKCTVALNDDDNVVGILKKDGTVHINKEKLMLWAGGLFSGNVEQLGCPLAFKNGAAN
jgi:uncharacterized protein